ncbi:radical SAM protein [Bacteroidota bacterium]
MSTFLFDETVFGPVKSRRLGNSLGINLLSNNSKVCNFNCIYCECGLTPDHTTTEINSKENVFYWLRERLFDLKYDNIYIDSITFAGNGEPTLHPDFDEIIDYTIDLRNKLVPHVRVAVLSNASLIGNESIFRSLAKLDLNILKLDSAFEDTIRVLNCPPENFHLNELVENLQQFKGNLIIQTLFLRGNFEGNTIDNTSEKEINGWLKLIKEINPKEVMIYSFSRSTPVKDLVRVEEEELNKIAERVHKIGINTLVTP